MLEPVTDVVGALIAQADAYADKVAELECGVEPAAAMDCGSGQKMYADARFDIRRDSFTACLALITQDGGDAEIEKAA